MRLFLLATLCIWFLLPVTVYAVDGYVFVQMETSAVFLSGELAGQTIRQELDAPPIALQIHPDQPLVWLAYPGATSRLLSFDLLTGKSEKLAEFPGYISDFAVNGKEIAAALKSGPDFATSCVKLLDGDGQLRIILDGEDWFYNAPRFLPDGRTLVASRAWLPDPEIPKLTVTEVVSIPLAGGLPRVLAGGDWAYDIDGSRTGYRAAQPSVVSADAIGFLKSNDTFERFYSVVRLGDGKIKDLIGPEETMSFPTANRTMLYFIRYAEPGDAAGELMRVPLTGGEPVSIAKDVLRFAVRQ